MLEQSILDSLDPAVLAALKEREKDYDTFNKQQDDPPAPSANANKYNFFDEEDDPFMEKPPPTQNYMGTEGGNDDPVLNELDRNAYFEHDRRDDARSEQSVALSNKSEEDTMEKRRNYVVEIIELAEELNCSKRLPDEMTMMAMPFNRLVTMWHLYDERVTRSTVMRMVRNAFAMVCIAAGHGVEFFLKRVLDNSFMDWSVWRKNFYAKVTTERPQHRPPFDRALQKVLNRFTSVKDLMSGEGSLMVMTCMHVYKEYRRQEDARKAEEDKLQAMRQQIKLEVAAEMKEQVKEAMMEERRNYPMPPSPPSVSVRSAAAASVHSAPDFDTQSMLSGHSWEQEADLVSEKDYVPSESSPVIEEIIEAEEPLPVSESPVATQPLNGQISDPMDIDLDMNHELDELASQATSRTQQSGKKKRNKKEIVPDLIL